MTALRALVLASRLEDDELAQIAGGRAPHVLPVANVPLVVHGVKAALDCGAAEIAVAVSPATHADVRNVLGDVCPGGTPVRYLELEPPVTFAGALAAATEMLGDGPLLVHNGDSLVLSSLAPLARELLDGGPDALVLVRDDGEPNGAVDLDRRRLLRLVDEPPPPPSEHLLAGAYLLGPRVLDVARSLAGGAPERQSAAATLNEIAADSSATFETRAVRGAWKYTGSVDGLLDANRLVLDELPGARVEADVTAARVEGRVAIHRSAVLDRVTIRGPAVIGAGAVLVDTFVGPYTSIGEDVRMDGAEVEHSIVLRGASVRHPGKRLESSLIGQDAVVAREFSLPATLRLRVGRRAEISLS